MSGNTLSKWALGAICGLATVGVAQSAQAQDSFVRVLHALPGGPKVDFYFDGQKTLNDYRFGGNSKYVKVPSGYRRISVRSNDPARTLFSRTPRLRPNDFYTGIAWGTPSRPRFTLHNDSAGNVPFNRARITFFHLSPGLPPVDVVGTTQTGRSYRFLRGLRYGQIRYAHVPAVPMTIRLVAYGRTVKTYTGAEPRAGRKYSAYAIGRPRESFNLFLDTTASQ